MARFVGEYRPPREIVAMSGARVTGPGHLDVGAEGLHVEGRVLTAPVVPRAALSVLVLAGVLVSGLVPALNQVAIVVTVGIGGLGAWLYWRSEFGVRASRPVPWAGVEHVVRLESDPDVLAIVLRDPIGGPGSPEQLYFAATLGAEQLAEVLVEHAPEGVTLDLG